MVLSDSEIRVALQSKALIITPTPPDDHITTSAIDLTLGKEFHRWKPPGRGARLSIDPTDPVFSYYHVASQYLEPVIPDSDGRIILQAGDFLLALTEERVELPKTSRLAARVEGRSTLARLGLGVHMTAPTIHCGFKGNITLEITHQSPIPINLRAGMRICQLILEQVFGTPSGAVLGPFQDQASVTGVAQP